MSVSSSQNPQTPEAIAYHLLWDVFAIEKHETVTKKLILETYRECLRAAKDLNPPK